MCQPQPAYDDYTEKFREAIKELLSQHGQTAYQEVLDMLIQINRPPGEPITAKVAIVSNNPFVQSIQRHSPVGQISICNNDNIAGILLDAMRLIMDRRRECWPTFLELYASTGALWSWNASVSNVLLIGQVDIKVDSNTFTVMDSFHINRVTSWSVLWKPNTVSAGMIIFPDSHGRIYFLSEPDLKCLAKIKEAISTRQQGECNEFTIKLHASAALKLQYIHPAFPPSVKIEFWEANGAGVSVCWETKQEGIYRDGTFDWCEVMPLLSETLLSLKPSVVHGSGEAHTELLREMEH